MSIVTLGSGNQDFLLTLDSLDSIKTVSDFRSVYFSASLDGAQETPPHTTAASGTGAGHLNFAQDRFEFSLSLTGIDIDGAQTAKTGDNALLGHIHQAAPGVAGPAVFDFFHGDETDTVKVPAAGTITGGWDSSEGLATNRANLLADGLYFNIHTNNFPDGDVRGQIINQHDGNDRIDLTALGIGDFATVKALIHNRAGNGVITLHAEGHKLDFTFAGLTAANLLRPAFYVFETSTASERIRSPERQRNDLFGAGGADTIMGGAGYDRLFGENGNDSISGGLDRDTISGGADKDQLKGGADSGDVFTFASTADSAATRGAPT